MAEWYKMRSEGASSQIRKNLRAEIGGVPWRDLRFDKVNLVNV